MNTEKGENEKCKLRDMEYDKITEYGEKTENHEKCETCNVGGEIWPETLKK